MPPFVSFVFNTKTYALVEDADVRRHPYRWSVTHDSRGRVVVRGRDPEGANRDAVIVLATAEWRLDALRDHIGVGGVELPSTIQWAFIETTLRALLAKTKPTVDKQDHGFVVPRAAKAAPAKAPAPTPTTARARPPTQPPPTPTRPRSPTQPLPTPAQTSKPHVEFLLDNATASLVPGSERKTPTRELVPTTTSQLKIVCEGDAVVVFAFDGEVTGRIGGGRWRDDGIGEREGSVDGFEWLAIEDALRALLRR